MGWMLVGGCGLAMGQGAPDAHAACASLRGAILSPTAIDLPTLGAEVDSAKIKHLRHAEFCKVLGQIRSVDPAAQNIHFELNLPTQWNGKVVHYGGGGFDGALSKTSGLRTEEVGIVRDPVPLERGYATFGSDSGHHHFVFPLPNEYNELLAGFARNGEERRNYAHDGLKKTHDVAVELIRRRYGVAPRRMFFIGGSTGGREAYFVTQLWPRDYDGVLGAYAGWNQVQLDLQFIRVSQAEYRHGTAETRGWLPKRATRLVAGKVMEQCDAADGVRDGIISNPEGCHFDPAPLLCGQGAKHCLTPGQLESFQVFASEQRSAEPLKNGVQTIPGFNVYAGTDLSGSMGLFRHAFEHPLFPFNSFYYVVASGVLRDFLTGKPHFNALTFKTTTGGAYASALPAQSAASDASDADLSAFRRHGGKLILLHGTADATIPTGSTVEFYRMMQARMGPEQVDSFTRMYLVPGYGHTRGVFNTGFDSLAVLDGWLDSGKPPETLVATDNNRSQHGRTRPLCVYPAWPKYVGGDVNTAASFACTAPTR